MTDCEYFSMCVGVHPKIYSKYAKRKPFRQKRDPKTIKLQKEIFFNTEQNQTADGQPNSVCWQKLDQSSLLAQNIRGTQDQIRKTDVNGTGSFSEISLSDELSRSLVQKQTQQAMRKTNMTGYNVTTYEEDESKPTEDNTFDEDDSECDDNGPPVSCASWFSLAVIFMIQLGNVWQRSLPAYSFAYMGMGEKAGNPKYEITSAIPGFEMAYSSLIGVIFLLPFALLGIVTGQLVDAVNSRKTLFGLASILWSTTTLIQGLYPNLIVFSFMRFFLAVFESAGNPLMYSMLRDYFPPSKRVLTTSIVGSTINLGVALSNLSGIIINQYGWQINQYVTAGYGIFIGIFALIALREPQRGQYDKKNLQTCKEQEKELATPKLANQESLLKKLKNSFVGIIKQPCARWILVAGFFRFFGGYTFLYYNPTFFNSKYPEYQETFAQLNAALVVTMCFASSFIGGYIGDNVRKDDPMTKAYYCSFCSFLAAPFLFSAYFLNLNFWFSISMVGFEYLIGEGWTSSCFAMLLDVTDPKTQGMTVNVFYLFSIIATLISTQLMGVAQIVLDFKNQPQTAGYTLGGIMMVSLIGGGISFLIAGFHYRKFMMGN